MLRRVLGIGMAAGLAAAGIAVQAQTNQPAEASAPPKPGQAATAAAGSAEIVAARLEKLAAELSLTAKQKPQIKEILVQLHEDTVKVTDEAKARIKEVNTTGSPEKAAVQATIRSKARADIRILRKEAHDKIAVILTEEQKAKFAALRAKRENDPAQVD